MSRVRGQGISSATYTPIPCYADTLSDYNSDIFFFSDSFYWTSPVQEFSATQSIRVSEYHRTHSGCRTLGEDHFSLS
jgi:hypothetical protein